MLDGSFRINDGLRIARGLLLDINAMGVPAGCEFLDTITPQYTADLVSWGAIGARTTESQVHRQLASGLSCPIGFKNGTDGGVRIALDAIAAASQPHHFPAVTKDGRAAIASTTGNQDCHIVLRGGRVPNYDAESVDAVSAEALRLGLQPRIMIDASHANSGKDPENQPRVLRFVSEQIAAGDRRIVGVMIESHLVAGRQDLMPGQKLVYGQSITDGCIDWETSIIALETLAHAVQRRRRA
jgi:3-deoxy-7-phosphoheptulonate synthase